MHIYMYVCVCMYMFMSYCLKCMGSERCGSIALYKSSHLLVSKHANVSFFNNHTRMSGG